MISVRYHPELIEQAVLLAVRRDTSTEIGLHHEIDPLFELPQDDNREERFRDVFVEWFRRLELDQFVDEALLHFPKIVEQVAEAVVRATPRRKSEGAELFVRNGPDGCRRTLAVQLLPESLVEPDGVRDAMLRELQHAEDMLDEAFGYKPASIDGLPSQQQVVRDRYGVLWNIRVEAALASRGLVVRSNESRLRSQFEQTFTLAGVAPPAEAFVSVWDRACVTHTQLLSWAADPRAWLHRANNRPTLEVLGDACPACRFPTFDWFERSDSWDDEFVGKVRQSAPTWTPDDGICRQCAETSLFAETSENKE